MAFRYGRRLGEGEEEAYSETKRQLSQVAKDSSEISKGSELGTVRALPRWQTAPLNLIEDVMARWLGPIETEEAHKGVQDRLKYLKGYLPGLKGDILRRAKDAIRLLEERVAEYRRKNLKEFISQVAELVAVAIEDDAGLKKAQDYLAYLIQLRPGLRGSWARTVDEYATRLNERMREYRERSPKPTEERKEELGSPQEIPEILTPFYITTDTSWAEHRATSKYCRITTIRPGVEWLLGFEEGDESFATQDPSFAPDWDFDEPVLRVIKTDNILNITTEKYGGYTHAARVNYGATILWPRVGGDKERHIGETVGLDLSTRKIVAPGEVPVWVWEKIKKYLPWGIAIGALGFTTYRVATKK